jgi:putative SOS response-associated peptidase YedK
MCGRYTLANPDPARLRARFDILESSQIATEPRYNIAPTDPVLAIRRREDGAREAGMLRWGLVPGRWAEKGGRPLINARAESLAAQPAFAESFRERRCLIPADGFYEWKRGGATNRPWFVRRKGGGPIAFAGLWETWIGPNGEEMETAAIVTTTANAEMGQVHHRAPVIVPPEQFDFWLDTGNVDAKTAAELFVPAPDGAMEVFEISPAVNRVANDSAELIAPADPNAAPQAPPPKPRARKRVEDDGQASLF